jgi:hypothetical protein
MDPKCLPHPRSTSTEYGSRRNNLAVRTGFHGTVMVALFCLVVLHLQQYLRGTFPASAVVNNQSWNSPAALPQENHGDNHNLAVTTYPPSPKRFHELLDNITMIYTNNELYHTAYSDASQVIYNETHFFRPTRKCESTCCAETVAISLDQDDHHIRNTLDGTDMADTYLQQYKNAKWIHFFGSILGPDLLPCLQPGTIIHIDTHRDLLRYFFTGLRPNITVPYVLITSESDSTSPSSGFQQKLSSDTLMLKWFGINPSTKGLSSQQK